MLLYKKRQIIIENKRPIIIQCANKCVKKNKKSDPNLK